MNETNDELNRAIDRNLRDAHQQVNPRPEWTERVLREIACERERNNDVVATAPIRLPVGRVWSSGSWQSVAAIVAALMLAIAYGSWRASSSNRNLSNEAIGSKNAAISRRDLTEKLSLDLPIAEPHQSVIAAPGYLAGRLINDPDFEIYVVLPTRNTTKTH